MKTVELTSGRIIKGLLKNRLPQLAVLVLMLLGYLFAILSGMIGTPSGNHNFGIVFVWIAWWTILILVAIPLFGRGWCAVCPIPLPGDWLQRGAVLDPPRNKPTWLNLRWPRRLRNIWLQNVGFLLLALFSSVILTNPRVTSVLLAAMLFASLGLSLIFRRRAFCRYVCPVGGFIGLCSQAAPLELRIKNKSRCVTCAGKPCYNGSMAGDGCPWDVFPAGLSNNANCGLCLECIRTCPHDNIGINLRPFGADLTKSAVKPDQAFKTFVVLGSAMIYAAVMLGPWGALKNASFYVGTTAWAAYVVGFLAILLIILPLLFSAAVIDRKRTVSFRRRFSMLSTALIPLGLMFWIAFSLSFLLTNASYVWATLSDPLGVGWNLVGTANITWRPLLAAVTAPTQMLVLTGGLLWSTLTAQKAARAVRVSPLPVIGFCLIATLVMMWLLI